MKMSQISVQTRVSFTLEELEQHRLSELADSADDREITIDELRAQFSPGSFGCHEALQMALVNLDSVDRRICAHPAVLANPDRYRLASEDQTALFNLYQAIGNVHLRRSLTPTPTS